MITAGISEELHAGLTADIVLVDRPAPDALGYYLAALQHRGEQPPPAWLDYLIALVRHHAATYDLLLTTCLDPSIPLGTGKPRDPDPHFRILTDALHPLRTGPACHPRPAPRSGPRRRARPRPERLRRRACQCTSPAAKSSPLTTCAAKD
jgi:hypothetical protein